jgi:hypothetical protein
VSTLNVTAIADVIGWTLGAYDAAVGAPPRDVTPESAATILIESVRWVLDNPMADEFALLRAWGVEGPFVGDMQHVAARAGIVRALALELGGEV